MEANCDDSSDVMKRLRGHRAVIIRDNRRDREVGCVCGGVGRGCGWTTVSATSGERRRGEKRERV